MWGKQEEYNNNMWLASLRSTKYSRLQSQYTTNMYRA